MYATATPCRGCGSDPLFNEAETYGGLAAYEWNGEGKARGLAGLGSVFDYPTVTGVVQMGMDQVRFSASGVNFRLLGSPSILAALETTEGYCSVIQGERTDGGFIVSGFTLLTDDSAGGEGSLYTNCADILAGGAGAGLGPNTDTPSSGGGTQPPPGGGQTAAEGGGATGNGAGASSNGDGEMPELLEAGFFGGIGAAVAATVATGLILAAIANRGSTPPPSRQSSVRKPHELRARPRTVAWAVGRMRRGDGARGLVHNALSR